MIEAREIVFAYRGQRVLDRVDVTVSRGEVVSLVGPNGAGKSTLLKCIAAIHRPQEGSVSIDGVSPFSLPRRMLARQVAYLPQSPRFRFPSSAFEIVLSGRRPYFSWRPSMEDMLKVRQIMARLDLMGLAERNMDQLSGGQRQKVLLAKVLVQETPYLLLDEPNTGLDLRHQMEILEIVADQAAGNNVGVLMALHDLNLAVRFSDRIIMIHQGRIVAQGAPREVVTEDRIKKIYGVEAKISCENGNIFVHVIKSADLAGKESLGLD